jgi:hypothetical protein
MRRRLIDIFLRRGLVLVHLCRRLVDVLLRWRLVLVYLREGLVDILLRRSLVEIFLCRWLIIDIRRSRSIALHGQEARMLSWWSWNVIIGHG